MHIHQGFSFGVCSINKNASAVQILWCKILMCWHPAWYVFGHSLEKVESAFSNSFSNCDCTLLTMEHFFSFLPFFWRRHTHVKYTHEHWHKGSLVCVPNHKGRKHVLPLVSIYFYCCKTSENFISYMRYFHPNYLVFKTSFTWSVCL